MTGVQTCALPIYLAFEASSHGLDQYRLDGVRIQAGGFTNLSRDHMDYHPDVAHYLNAKLRLFRDLVVDGGAAVISADHDCSPEVIDAAGKALLMLSKGETWRLLTNMPSAYRAAVNFGERTVTLEGPTRGRILMRRDFMPCAWHEGVLLAALEGMKARAVRVSCSRLEVLDSEYLVTWE